jgi:hypothetical protein
MLKSMLVVFAMLVSSVALARPACYEDPRTAARTCYDKGGVREEGGIRYSRMYRGGPKGVNLTGYEFAVNCKTGVMHLKDEQGVSFAGGHRGDTEAATSIVDWICSEPIGRSAPKKK